MTKENMRLDLEPTQALAEHIAKATEAVEQAKQDLENATSGGGGGPARQKPRHSRLIISCRPTSSLVVQL